MSEFFEALFGLGAEDKRWRSWWAIGGLIVGAGLGGWVGAVTGGGMNILYGLGVGAFFGWLVVILAKGFARFVVIGLGGAVPVLIWMWISGEFG
ncbi:MAG: hypothetical protein AAFQ36_03110 [Pseudomonadota bacterium]